MTDATDTTDDGFEWAIVERAWEEGWITPQPAGARSGRSVGVIGSGPAGLAAAQQMARAGHAVTVARFDLQSIKTNHLPADFKFPGGPIPPKFDAEPVPTVTATLVVTGWPLSSTLAT